MFTLLTQSSQANQLIVSAFALYKQSIKQTYFFSILTTSFFLLSLYGPYLLDPEKTSAFHTFEVIYLLVAELFALFFMLSLTFSLHCQCYRLKCTVVQALKQSFYRIVPILLTLLLYAIIVLAGTIILIMPGIIFCLSLMFAFFMVLNENKGILSSLTTSHNLVWGCWWHTFIVISTPLLLSLALNLLSFVALIYLTVNFSIDKQIAYYASFGFQVILQSLLLPFVLSVALVLLNDLRLRRSTSVE